MVQIRLSTGFDAPAMTDLFLKARREAMPYLPVIHTEEQTLWWMQNIVVAAGGTRVAIDEERVVGFATLNGDWLDHLYVAPEAQGRGVGRSLLRSVFKTAPSALALRVFQKNQKARSFYERQGFALVELNDGSENEERTPEAVYQWRPPAS